MIVDYDATFWFDDFGFLDFIILVPSCVMLFAYVCEGFLCFDLFGFVLVVCFVKWLLV